MLSTANAAASAVRLNAALDEGSDRIAIVVLPAHLPAGERAALLLEIGAVIEAVKATRPVEVITAPGVQFDRPEVERIFVVYEGERPVLAGEK